MVATSPLSISGPDPFLLEGRVGSRYWVNHPYPFTGNAAVDDRLSGYPVVVFRPSDRPAHETPVVLALQGMAAPYQWNGFLVPTLLDMGIACVLFDTPLAGERSLGRNYRADITSELASLLEHQLIIDASLAVRVMDGVARDIQTVLGIARDRHGLIDSRVALFGVSLGTLLTSFAFMRDGVGIRLLGSLGHADLAAFARSYTPFFASIVGTVPGRLLGKLAALYYGPVVTAGVEFLGVLQELGSGGARSAAANPMAYRERVGPPAGVRANFPTDCYVVPGLANGFSTSAII